jgi:hypothetical protein
MSSSTGPFHQVGPGMTTDGAPLAGAHPQPQPFSIIGAQGEHAGAFWPRVKHDSQPIADDKKIRIAVTINSLCMIYSPK